MDGDTSNNALFDPHLKQYLAFSRLDNHVRFDKYGMRKETISNASSWDEWSGHAVCLRGTKSGQLDGESYSLVPFRLPSFAPGLYLGLAAFYDENSGIVTNELLRSTSYGRSWTRLSPGKAFIPHGKTLDNFTTYAARALLDPQDPSGTRLLMYYAGGERLGPQEHRTRANTRCPKLTLAARPARRRRPALRTTARLHHAGDGRRGRDDRSCASG